MMNTLVLKKEEFLFLKDFIYQHIGISLSEQKIYLVQGRLNKRLKELRLNSFKEYCDLLRNDVAQKELSYLSTFISTNVTSFFREGSQWKFLEENLAKITHSKNKKLRIWSAASSTGEEPYSIMMFLYEHLNDVLHWDIKLLATDISTKVLKQAKEGKYKSKAYSQLEARYRAKYFTKVQHSEDEYTIKEMIKKDIVFRIFNLVTGNYKIFTKKKFDIIFCRNVMIYFDKATQSELVKNFYDLLEPGGYLFIGSSEALTDLRKGFKLVSPSIYQKV